MVWAKVIFGRVINRDLRDALRFLGQAAPVYGGVSCRSSLMAADKCEERYYFPNLEQAERFKSGVLDVCDNPRYAFVRDIAAIVFEEN
jgi:hypothetical protein